MTQLIIKEIADFLINTVKQMSNPDFGGFRYIIMFSEVENYFSQKLDSSLVREVEKEVASRKDVACCEVYNECYDIVLFTGCAPNYQLTESM